MSVIRPVLIVGAGLTGLAAAMELSRLGVPVRLIDKRPGPSAMPRTLVVHSWTAELLGQRGLRPETLPASNQVTHAAVYRKGGLLGTVQLAPDRDHRGHVLLVCQAEMDRMLREQLARQDVAVEYGTELVALVQAEPGRHGEPGGPGVTALLRHSGGRLEDIAAPYLISADGMHGTTGHLLNLPAHGKLDGLPYVLAGLRLDGDLRDDVVSVFLGHRGFVMLLPTGGGWFQCIATDPSARSGDHGEPGMAELQQLIDGCLPAPARLREMRGSSRCVAAGRLSPPLRHGHVLFGGDSAYAHSPATGQGENSGIQDMINLGWKLAMVLQEKAAPDLLGTYAKERLQVTRQIERKAEVPAHLLGPGSALVRTLVTRITPTLLDSCFPLELCADLAGEVIPDYWSSPLSAPPRGPGSLQPGSSVPDMRVLTRDPGPPAGSHPRATRLHELVSPSRLNLLLTDETGSAAAHSAWPGQQLQPWQGLMAVHRVAPVRDHEEQLRFYRAFGGGQTLILVRPDSHVCFAGRRKDLPRLVTWMNTWFPPGPGGGPPVRRRQSAGRLHWVLADNRAAGHAGEPGARPDQTEPR
jgi:2-polyprenyl-6-methoxyphenol hydroxylase-like FAD-dependent oxidoreductase